jgi:hypothetical protein
MTTPPDDDSDLRRLLNDAVADVHPTGGTEQVRAAARRPSVGRWLPLTAAAAVATVLVIGGGAWLAQRSPDPQQAAGPSAPSVQDTTTTAPEPGHDLAVPVYYVGTTASGPRLFSETHQLTGVTGTDLQAAVDEALSGSPTDPDYANPFESLGLSAQAAVADGAVTIDFSAAPERPAGMSDEEAQMAVQSLVWTADAAAKATGPVQLTVAGSPADRVLGVPSSAPVDRAGADSVLSTVSITAPAQDATVPTTFEVTGQASTFEANVVWELKQGNTVVRHGFTTASQCCTLSPYTFTVTATPGDYTLVVHDTDESDGEGVGTSRDTKDVRVQ